MNLAHVCEYIGLADVALFVLLSRKRRSLLLALIGVAGGLQFQISKLHLATILIAVLVLVTRRPRPHAGTPQAVVVVLCAGVLALSTPFGDLVNNPLLSGQLLALAASCGLLMMWTTSDDHRLLLLGLLAGCSLGAGIGDLQNLHLLHATYFLDSSGIPRVHSIYPEPDSLGFFAAVGVVLAYRLVRDRRWQIGLIVVNGAALIFAFARASWIALGVSVVVALLGGFVFGRVKPQRSNIAVGIGLTLGMAGVLAGDPHLRHTVVGRLGELSNTSGTHSLEARQNQIKSLLALARTAPWHGHGLSASGHVSGFGTIHLGHTQNSVATNWVLGWWVDGAVLAIPIIVLFIYAALRYAPTVAGQCLVLLEINSLFSNAMMLPIPWLLLAVALTSGGPIQKDAAALDWHRPVAYATG